jgi:hypothetical protein
MKARGPVRQSPAQPGHALRAECHAFLAFADLLAAGDFAAQKDH